MIAKDISRILSYAVGLIAVALLIYVAGPLLEIGGYRPLENRLVRVILIVLLVAAVGSFVGFQFWRRNKNSAQIAQGISAAGKDESDAAVLKERMKDALATLKKASGRKADYLYELPWYILVGPPGSGKTTALVNSGLKFPLSRGATPAAVAGVGGTRYCDWWFTDDAVLIDTAGRYTTQDSDEKLDRQSWFAFLDLLKKNRPRQPINGVLVAISLEDLMMLSAAELSAHANAIRARLLDLHEHLKIDFPVYVLFTKGDLVAGFMEYFANLGEQGRRQVWGATFQTGDKTQNMVGDVPAEFDALVERLSFELTDRLQEEPAPGTRVALFGFPTQIAALKRPIFDFLNQIFEPTRYHANATLRGFYFTSGTQQGTPIDQLIGALVKSFGAEEIRGSAYSGMGKSFFLTDLIQKVVIGEAAWVSTDRAAVRRARIIKAALYSGLVVASAALAGAWWVSYSHNKQLIAQTNVAIAEHRAAAGALANETQISDRDFGKILPALHELRFLPDGYAGHNTPTPLAATFGLSQRERLLSSSENVYHLALERMLRPRMIFRMEELLEANRGNSSFVYQALKVYMMLGGLQRPDRDLIVAWWRQDWADNLYPGAANGDGRKELEEHLLAMLDLEGSEEPLVTLNGALLEDSQRSLARLSVAQRAYEVLKSQAQSASAQDWVAERRGGPDFALVFEPIAGETLDKVRVPYFYTYAGFNEAFIDHLGDIAEQVKRDRWVLGTAGQQSAVAAQYGRLDEDLLDLYTKDFVAAWRRALSKLRLVRLTADKPKYLALGAAAAATSPIKQLLESIHDETALTRDRPSASKPPTDANKGSTKADGGSPTLLRPQGRAPGANIEASFNAFHVQFEGDASHRPIDEVLSNLNEIDHILTLTANDPAQATQANGQLQLQVAALRTNANRLPPPFSDMLLKAADSFEGDLANASHAQLLRALGDQVIGTCQQVIPSRYPFTRGAEREVPLPEFARLFRPNGVIDKFFTQNLEPLADKSKQDWSWRQDSQLARELSPATLREFQSAAQIRDAFFPVGGNMPAVALTVTPPVINTPGVSAKLEIDGVAIVSQQGSNAPVAVQWPGSSGVGRTAITVASGSGGEPSILQRDGIWSLFRMVDSTSPTNQGDRVIASFIVGGLELKYQFSAGSLQNPLALAALREFHCPRGL
jgi:type VI secretion system protein ImpL